MSLQVKVGTFTGTGSTQSITGLGFQPQLVMLQKASTTTSEWNSMKIDSMPSSDGYAWTDNSTALTTRISSLDADGFTVGNQAGLVENTKVFYYVAVKGSSDVFATGSYSGNGSDNRNVVTGLAFQPDMVIIKGTNNEHGCYRTDQNVGDNSTIWGSGVANAADHIQALNSDGFQVGTSTRVNGSGNTYYWAALKKVTSLLTTGKYTGNGSDNHDVTGAGLQADFIFIKEATGTLAGVLRTSDMSGDNSLAVQNASTVLTADLVQSIASDGFQVGTDTRVNQNTIVYPYFAFKTSPPELKCEATMGRLPIFNANIWYPSVPLPI
jgi:hypothetical protein